MCDEDVRIQSESGSVPGRKLMQYISFQTSLLVHSGNVFCFSWRTQFLVHK